MAIRIDGTNTAANPGITGTDTDTGLQFGTDEVNIVTGGSTAVTVDSSQRVGIGETSPNRQLVINGGTSEGVIQITNDTSGTAAANGFELIHFTNGETQLLNRENGAMRFDTNGTERMRLLADGGLTFNGDTSAANALNDYEEGTFTPTWQATTNSGTWAATGRYTKIGKQVTVEVKQTSGQVSASAGDHIIDGLPFQPTTGTTGAVGSITDTSPLLNGSILVWTLTRFYTAVAISTNSGLRISITYMTDD